MKIGSRGAWALAAMAVIGIGGASACASTRGEGTAGNREQVDSGLEGGRAADAAVESATTVDSGREGGAMADHGDGSPPVNVGAAGTAHGSGTVTAVTAIAPVGACSWGEYWSDGIEKGFGFFFDDGSATSFLRVGLPWNRPLLSVGQKVSVEATGGDCGGPTIPRTTSDLVIRDEHGTLLVWIVWSGDTSVTPPPEVSIEHGPPRSVTTVPCATVTAPRLSMSIGGTKVPLEPGATQIGEYVALYDGFPDVTASLDTCNVSDWYMQSASFGVVRGNLGELALPPRCGGASCAPSEYCELPPDADCSATATLGVCKPRPASCPTPCDPVSTCDGYACNACQARQNGQTVTNDALCAATGFWSRPTDEPAGTCTERLSCIDPTLLTRYRGGAPAYEMHCTTGDAGAVACECLRNDVVTRTVHPGVMPACTPESASSVCGFSFGGTARADAAP